MIDERRLLHFWQIEQSSPRWLKDSSELWHENAQGFLDYCAQCYQIHDLGDALLYVQKVGDIVEIQFGAERKEQVDIERLKAIRTSLLAEFQMLFGWILRQNRGVRGLCENLGLQYHGVQMFFGESHGKVLEWRCYSIDRNSIALN